RFFRAASAAPEISPLSLHAALPISTSLGEQAERLPRGPPSHAGWRADATRPCRRGCFAGEPQGETLRGRTAADGVAETHLPAPRSEEHTSELQSRENLVCRLLLEKK